MRKELSIGLGMLSFAAVAVAGAMGLRALPRPIEALERGAGVLRAEAGALRYEAAVSPAEDRERLRARLDRHTELAVQPVGDDGIALELPGLSPGLHFVELELTRRGGRVTRFSDEVVSGPWQHERERGCDLGLVLGPQGVHDLLLPVVETKLLAGARSNAYFGPTSVLPRKVLEVVDGGLRFDVALDTSEEDKGDLRVAGVIDVRGSGDAGIIASLRRLDTAAPGPKLEALARAEERAAWVRSGSRWVAGWWRRRAAARCWAWRWRPEAGWWGASSARRWARRRRGARWSARPRSRSSGRYGWPPRR